MARSDEQILANIHQRSEDGTIDVAPDTLREVEAGNAFLSFETLMRSPEGWVATLRHLQNADRQTRTKATGVIEHYLAELDGEQRAMDADAAAMYAAAKSKEVITALLGTVVGLQLDLLFKLMPVFTIIGTAIGYFTAKKMTQEIGEIAARDRHQYEIFKQMLNAVIQSEPPLDNQS